MLLRTILTSAQTSFKMEESSKAPLQCQDTLIFFVNGESSHPFTHCFFAHKYIFKLLRIIGVSLFFNFLHLWEIWKNNWSNTFLCDWFQAKKLCWRTHHRTRCSAISSGLTLGWPAQRSLVEKEPVEHALWL